MSNLLNLKKGNAWKTAKTHNFDVDNGSGTTVDEVLIVPQYPITVVGARAVPNTTTIATGGSAATVQLGITLGGAEIVAATNLVGSTNGSVGTELNLTIVSGSVAAGNPVFVRHTGRAATVAGEYFVEIDYTGND